MKKLTKLLNLVLGLSLLLAVGCGKEEAKTSEGKSAVPDAAALIKGAVNEENAKLFLDYIVNTEVQTTLATDFKIRAVRDDIAAPEGLVAISDIKLVDYDFGWASDNKKEIVTRWKNIVSGKE